MSITELRVVVKRVISTQSGQPIVPCRLVTTAGSRVRDVRVETLNASEATGLKSA